MHVSWAVLQVGTTCLLKWRKYLLTMSTQPQASWSPRPDNMNPCDTTWLSHHQPIREPCTSWSLPCDLLLTCPLKMLCQNLSGSSGLSGHEPPRLLVWPHNKPFSALDSDVFCLPALTVHRGTWTCLYTTAVVWLASVMCYSKCFSHVTSLSQFEKHIFW